MAFCELHPAHTGLSRCVAYVLRWNKTNTSSPKNHFVDITEPGKRYVAALNASIDFFDLECMTTKESWGKTDGILYHHGAISFAKEDPVTPELALQIAKEVLEEHTEGRFEVLMAVHFDRPHLHVNFIINSVSFVDGKKYYGQTSSLRRLRKISDRICEEYGLSTINKDTKKKKDAWRDMVRRDIDVCIDRSTNLPSFFRELKDMGYLLKDGKHFGVSPPGYYHEGRRRFVRLRSLKNDDYTLEGIERRLTAKMLHAYGTIHPGPRARKVRARIKTRRKMPRLLAVYYCRMYKLGLLPHKPAKLSTFRMKQGQKEARDLSRRIRYMHQNGICSEDDLKLKVNKLEKSLTEKKKSRKRLYNEKYRNQANNDAEISTLTEEINQLNQEYLLCKKIGVIPTMGPVERSSRKEERRDEKCPQKHKQQNYMSELWGRESVK